MVSNIEDENNFKKFDVLNERKIKHYISKNALLEQQNAGLRLEVQKMKSEIRQKNSTIYALKEEERYFEKKHQKYIVPKKKLSEKEREVTKRDILKAMSANRTLKDVQDIFRGTTDRSALIKYIFIMKNIIFKKTKTINYPQGQLLRQRGSLEKERSKN
ncbi:PREDICTED: uncharacterized protein LOC105452950 [Wasmannia auropunctata]|uniref:uncharacterized protein LOC105452950 n=1 Tax=Wasmannia auropunctata TaxID=64793 RepID=UPI0005EFDB7A|nr:PREDICTED: uncharacterized protein LOC105452950 [Wasmannia auropunctata]